jgi:hypothetical protein
VEKEELERRLRLNFDATSTILVVDGIAVENAKVGVKFHTETTSVCPSIMVEGIAFQLDN